MDKPNGNIVATCFNYKPVHILPFLSQNGNFIIKKKTIFVPLFFCCFFLIIGGKNYQMELTLPTPGFSLVPSRRSSWAGGGGGLRRSIPQKSVANG